ncbi:MAG TPA: hypothetical protein VHT96_16440 [Clostridia bacterium]|nr:hypothetical protein [Clostridia bacterium]
MAYLGDYIGYILSELTNARAQADSEAVRLAEIYAGDQYLKHVPVPRFRTPTITLDIPIAINSIQDEGKAVHTNDQMLTYMQKKLRGLLPGYLQRLKNLPLRNLSLKNKLIDDVNTKVNNVFSEFKQAENRPLRVTYIADKLIPAVIGDLKSDIAEEDAGSLEKIEAVESDLRQVLYSEFGKYVKGLPRLNISATAGELKEAGPADVLAYLHITLTENAFEWDTSADGGKAQRRRLIPE